MGAIKSESRFKHKHVVLDTLDYKQGNIEVSIELRDGEVKLIILKWLDVDGWSTRRFPGGLATLEDLHIATGCVIDVVKNIQRKKAKGS